MYQRRRSAGFTLIELLVVIAIIVVLAAILFPIFAKAREKAKQTACINNMKQIGSALEMYVDDNETLFPNSTARIGLETYWQSLPGSWPTSITGLRFMSEYLRCRTLPMFLQQYIKNMRSFECPADRGIPISTDYGGLTTTQAWQNLYDITTQTVGSTTYSGSSYEWLPLKASDPWLPNPETDPNAPATPYEYDGPAMRFGTVDPATASWMGCWVGRNKAEAREVARFPVVADAFRWHGDKRPDANGLPYRDRAYRTVLFADGHVEALTETDFLYLRDCVQQY